jgi:hypothetical protein
MPYALQFAGERPRPRCLSCFKRLNLNRYTIALPRRRCDACARREAAAAMKRIALRTITDRAIARDGKLNADERAALAR